MKHMFLSTILVTLTTLLSLNNTNALNNINSNKATALENNPNKNMTTNYLNIKAAVKPNAAAAQAGKLKATLDKVNKKDIKPKQPAKPAAALPIQNKTDGVKNAVKDTNTGTVNSPTNKVTPTMEPTANTPVADQTQTPVATDTTTKERSPQYYMMRDTIKQWMSPTATEKQKGKLAGYLKTYKDTFGEDYK